MAALSVKLKPISQTIPAIISIGHADGKIKFTQMESLPMRSKEGESKKGEERKEERKDGMKLYVLATMWNQRTNKICFSSEVNYTCSFTSSLAETQLQFHPLPTFGGDEKWKIALEEKSGEKVPSLKMSMECRWAMLVPIEDVYCQFLIKIS